MNRERLGQQRSGRNGMEKAQGNQYIIFLQENNVAVVVILFLLKAILSKWNSALDKMESKFVLALLHINKYCIFSGVKGNLCYSQRSNIFLF